MEALAAAMAAPGGRVLEVGFGMGISAAAIQRRGVAQHVLVEANGAVFARAAAFARAHPSALPLFGFWSSVCPMLPTAAFDGILFDAFPAVAYLDFFVEARRLLRPDGVLAFFFQIDQDEDQELESVQAELVIAGFQPEDLTAEALRLPISSDGAGGEPFEKLFYVLTVRGRLQPRRGIAAPTGASAWGATYGWSREDWATAPIDYDPESHLRVFDRVVMATDEAPCMDAYSQVVGERPAGEERRVLEIGYGMGISARKIQAWNVTQHVIAEPNENVFEVLTNFSHQRSNVLPLRGFWQDVIAALPNGTVDSIFFDTFPTEEGLSVHQYDFFDAAMALLRPGGVFTFFLARVELEAPDGQQEWEAENWRRLEAAGFEVAAKREVPYTVEQCDGAVADCELALETCLVHVAQKPAPPRSEI